MSTERFRDPVLRAVSRFVNDRRREQDQREGRSIRLQPGGQGGGSASPRRRSSLEIDGLIVPDRAGRCETRTVQQRSGCGLGVKNLNCGTVSTAILCWMTRESHHDEGFVSP